ncbi:putative glutamine ABC transporter permease protein GlnM [compost metagenome]
MLDLNFGAVLNGRYLDWLIAGACNTLVLFAAAWVSGLLLALVVVSMRQSGLTGLHAVSKGFVGYHRNVPGLVQIFIWYFGVPQVLPEAWQAWINAHGSEFIFVWIALTLNAAAFMSEDLRSGVRSLSPTQMEAARGLGLSYAKAMRFVVLPQALRVAVPPLTNQSLGLFKATSLAMAIGLAELTYAAHQIESESFRTFEVYAIASIFYWVCSFALMGIGHAWSVRLDPLRGVR